jgi:SAM-dependent methyltransferase
MDVLDVGSRDVNGNNRWMFVWSSGVAARYTGLDGVTGPNVDVVCNAHEMKFPDSSFDFIVSTEMLEHDPFAEKSVAQMIRVLRPGGHMLITCATTGRKVHGLNSYTPVPGHYRNIDLSEFLVWVNGKMLPVQYATNPKSHDLYYFGRKL